MDSFVSSIVPPYIDCIAPYTPGKNLVDLKEAYGLTSAVRLASNENPLGPSARAIGVLSSAVELNRYPDAAARELRQAIAHFHAVDSQNVVVGHGSNELIDLICRTFASSREHAVTGAPTFSCYRLSLQAANVPHVEVAMTDDMYWDVGALLGAMRPDTKLVFVASPNNPSGTYVDRGSLERLFREAPPSAIIVLDEAYVQFVDADDYVSALELAHLRDRWLVLRTFSKAYGLAALRVGYAVGPAELISYLDRARVPFNVGTLSMQAAAAALADAEHLTRYIELNRKERQRLSDELLRRGHDVVPSQANFVCARVARWRANAGEQLMKRGILVRSLPKPIDEWVRITVGLPDENAALLAALDEG